MPSTKVKKHTLSEKRHLASLKKKNGPCGQRRARRREHLQPVTLAEYTVEDQDSDMSAFQDFYAQQIAQSGATERQTLAQWRTAFLAWQAMMTAAAAEVVSVDQMIDQTAAECPECGGTGTISVSVSGNSPDTREVLCLVCGAGDDEEDTRERGDDDGSTYADPRDGEN